MRGVRFAIHGPCGNYTILWQSHAEDEHGSLPEAEGNFTAVLEYVDCYWWGEPGRAAARGERGATTLSLNGCGGQGDTDNGEDDAW